MPHPSTLSKVDAIVVGIGAIGSATLYHLAKRGWKVLGLEAQATVGHDQGSSHGDSRIIRHVYQEHPSYVALLSRAYAGWRALAGEGLPPGAPPDPVLHVTGCLNASAPGARAAHGHCCFDGAVAAAAAHRLPHEILSAAAVNAKFPLFSLPEGFQAVLDPAGGYVQPEKAVRRLAAAAVAAGAQLACGVAVGGWECGPDGVEVVDSNGRGYRAEKLVLAPGAWLPALVPELHPVLAVERQVVGWFGHPGAPNAEEQQMKPQNAAPDPVFLIDDEEGYYYGFPPAADPSGLLKIGKYNHLGQAVQDPSALDRRIAPEDEAALRRCLEKYFPAAAAAPMARAEACMFTNTPDGHFIMDVHPGAPDNVVIASACSGHGFKFAPALGEALAELAAGGPAAALPPEFAMHRLHRRRPGFQKVVPSLQQAQLYPSRL